MFNVNYKGTRRRSGIFIVNFEHSKTCSSVSIVNFDQENNSRMDQVKCFNGCLLQILFGPFLFCFI